jgi:hypothetical protein
MLLPTDPHTFKGVKPAIEYYAKLQETDVSAYAVEVRRKKFNTSFGAMIKMVKGVKGIDPEKVKRVEEVESKMDLLPSSGMSDTIHVMNLYLN